MTDRPTQIERAFALAASGTVSDTKELKNKLRSEGYPEDGQLYGRTLMAQLMKLIAEANAKSNG
jgi:20S proteasome alpha/beta subunit